MEQAKNNYCSSLEENNSFEIKSSLSTSNSISNGENENLTFTFTNLKTIFKENIEKLGNNEAKMELQKLLDKFAGNKEKPNLSFVLDKLTEMRADVKVYFDYDNNKLFAVKKLSLKDFKQRVKAIKEVINGYRINTIEKSEGFVRFYDFFLKVI